MINVTIKKENDVIVELNMKGHAEYDDYGKDIVCAGVSAMLITTVNSILEFDENSIEYVEENNFNLKNKKRDGITNKLLNNLVKLLKELELKYPKHIIVKEK